jgi:hypothetical protein
MHDPTEPLAWVARAEEDLALARSALRRKTPLTYGATFHCYLASPPTAQAEAVH